MDPQANQEEQLRLARDIQETLEKLAVFKDSESLTDGDIDRINELYNELEHDANRLAELVIALHEWNAKR